MAKNENPKLSKKITVKLVNKATTGHKGKDKLHPDYEYSSSSSDGVS
jgi:hypothetical protein